MFPVTKSRETSGAGNNCGIVKIEKFISLKVLKIKKVKKLKTSLPKKIGLD